MTKLTNATSIFQILLPPRPFHHQPRHVIHPQSQPLKVLDVGSISQRLSHAGQTWLNLALKVCAIALALVAWTLVTSLLAQESREKVLSLCPPWNVWCKRPPGSHRVFMRLTVFGLRGEGTADPPPIPRTQTKVTPKKGSAVPSPRNCSLASGLPHSLSTDDVHPLTLQARGNLRKMAYKLASRCLVNVNVTLCVHHSATQNRVVSSIPCCETH